MKARINFQPLLHYIVLFSGLAFYKASLGFIYTNNIAITYGYWGFSFQASLQNDLTGWTVYLFLSMLLLLGYKAAPSPSWVMVLLLYLISYAPSCVLYEKAGIDFTFFVLVTLYWFLIILLQKTVRPLRLAPSPEEYKRGSPFLRHVGNLVVILFAVYVFIQKIRFNGLYIQLSLDTVYDLRLAARDFNFGPYATYIFTWASMIFTLRAISALRSRNLMIFALMCVCQLLLFSIDGAKSVIFAIPVSIIGYYFFKKSYRLIFLSFGFSLLNFLGGFLVSAFNSFYVLGLFSFRILFVPALINYQFYDFFKKNPPDMLAQSVFRRFGAISNYDTPIPFLIGREYYDSGMYANTGMFGDAFSNFGAWGSALYPFLFVLALKLFDSATKGINLRNIIAIIVIISAAFANGAFFTVLLTSGFLLSMLYIQTETTLFQHNEKVKTKRRPRISPINGTRING
jgi:hypothetical protein